jgi:ubiquinone biosynthesis protein
VIHPRQILHLFRINRILVKHGLDEIVFATHLFRPYRFLLYLAPWNWFRRDRADRSERLRLTLEDLGPIYVKFGQILSTRRDLLPDDIAVELAKLQDQVPPFSGQEARAIIEEAYGKPINQMFSHFDETPLASASIAQVHPARLLDGTEVVIKVLRPDIEPVIDRDIELMYYVAGLAERFWKEGKRLRPLEVVSEFEKVIYDELDLIREAANAAQLRRNFENNDMLYVPEVYWDLARRNVIVMERINGTPVNDVDTLRAKGIDIKRLAEMGVEIFYTQVFQHNFFHADMHPGNIFVSDTGQYIAVDFGIMGTLTEEDQRYLAENFIAFFNRDYRRVAVLHVESGWVPENTRVDELEAAIRTVCEPNFNRPLKEISFGRVLMRLFETARRFNMEVQPQLVLLQKTLLNIEGLGRQLYPDLDLWQTAKPFLERWMAERFGPKKFFNKLKDDLPLLMEKMPDMPFLLHEYLKTQPKGRREFQLRDKDIRRIEALMKSTRNHLARGMIGGFLLVISTILFLAPTAGEIGHYLGWASAGIGALLVYFSLRK